MTAIAFPIQHASIEYGVEPDVRILDALFQQEGVLPIAGTTPLLVEALTPAAMQVRVKAGSAIVDFEDAPAAPQLDGGKRLFTLTADSLSGVPGNPGADWSATFGAAAANPRVDRVVARVLDSNYDGSGLYGGKLAVVAGAATPGADLTNLTGAATVPANALLLANVLIRASATDITAADIASTLSVRKEAKAAGQIWEKIAETTPLGADAASVTLSNLVLDDYEEIEVVVQRARTVNTNTSIGFIGLQINGDTGGNYRYDWSGHAFGSGITFFNTAGNRTMPFAVNSALVGRVTAFSFRIMRPASSDNPKILASVMGGGSQGGNELNLNTTGHWDSASKITSLSLIGYSSDFVTLANIKGGVGFTVTIYGRRTVTL